MWTTSPPDGTSWFQSDPELSLALIEAAGLDRTRALIDVGGGAARLVDRLIEGGYEDLTVLDIAPEALDHARARLGARARHVAWIVADITRWRPERRYALWHDRAVFHFLTEAADQTAYGNVLRAALAPDGQAVISTFALAGPERCSGLPVRRHDASSLVATLGGGFAVLETRDEAHVTPAGAIQTFLWCRIGLS